MGIFSKLFKGPEIDQAKSDTNWKKMQALFNQVVENGGDYKLVLGFTEDVSRFNYGLVHGSKSKIGNLLVGWNEQSQTIAVVPTVPDLSGCGDPGCGGEGVYRLLPEQLPDEIRAQDMQWGEIGAVLAVIVVVFIVEKVWFHIVEGVLGVIKRIFVKKTPGVWHTLQQDQEKEDDEHV